MRQLLISCKSIQNMGARPTIPSIVLAMRLHLAMQMRELEEARMTPL